MSTTEIIGSILAYLLVGLGLIASASMAFTILVAAWARWARRQQRQLVRETTRYLRETAQQPQPQPLRTTPPDDDDIWLAQL